MLSIRVAILLIAAVPLQACADGVRDPNIRVVEFSSDVCAPCRKMKPVVETLKREGYPITTLDFDGSRIEADWHGVSEIPAYVVFRRDQAERVLQGVQTERDLRQVFSPACAPAGKGRGQILPGPAVDAAKEEWMPAPELPPTPQAEGPPDHGPYHRDRTSPTPKTSIDTAGDPADILIYSYGPSQQASAAVTHPSPTKQAHPDPTPEESAALQATANSAESVGNSDQQARAEEFAAALAEARARILGGTDGQVTPGTATTDSAAADTASQMPSDSIASIGETDSNGSKAGAVCDLLGVSRGEALVWLISVGLGAAGFSFGGPVGAKLAKTAGLAVVRLLLRKTTQAKSVDTAPLNDDYAAQLNDLYALSGRSPTADATLGREFERDLTEAAKGNDQVALYARNTLRRVRDTFLRIHDDTPTPAEPIPDGNQQGRRP